MKESKAVYVTKHKIRDDQNLVYQIYAKHREYSTKYYDTNNFGCQYNSRKDNLICTCRNPKRQEMRYFSGSPKQIYAYHGSRSYTDIGVGSVKTLQRRKVKRVYLPETDDRGVGSSDLSSFVNRKIKKQKNSFYDHKRTSSKCIGGFQEYHSFISQGLSPIVQTKSGSTSPKMSSNQRSIEIGSNTIDKNVTTTGTQFEIEKKEHAEIIEEKVAVDKEKETPKKSVAKVSEQTQKFKCSNEIQDKKLSAMERKMKDVGKVYSSDSLVQHVHNLDNPSDEKQSRASIDPMENKLEREYRRIFSTKDRESKLSVDKPIPEFKSASLLRRRFEALRRGLKKDEKRDGKKNSLMSSQDSIPSRKDASVTSDPPSLEGRSFTNTKKYSPMQTDAEDKNKLHYDTERDSAQWPQSEIDSECQGVKGMFNLWGKKFKFEEETEKTKPTHLPSPAIDINKKPNKQTKPKKEVEPKKSGRKFFFFKKKSKDQKLNKPKEKEIYNPSGVTAGRCEIRDGLVMKMGSVTPKEKISRISEEGDEIQRKTWFKNFLASAITSARSVNVRWNNSMYATSSSTVFELMDTIYKNNGVVLKSRSEITSEESSYYRSYTKNKVNFDQNIEAWMIPKTIPDRPREIPVRIQSNREIKDRDMDMTISDQRWFIEKSKAFANKIEVVLLSKNFNRVNKKVSSEYLRIDIPKDFFDISSSDDSKQNHTSDEEVYKIVEYESDMNTKKALDKGDHASEIKVIVSVQDSSNKEAKILETVIKKPPMHRDVVIQGSNVNIPKRCDVIGVGIITQRDLRDIRKPILKIQNDLSDEDSDEAFETNPKKCEFAESYLQEYYRHWTPLGIDLFSWCVSDSHLRSCSEKSLISFRNQGDGSKSCPNIFEDFQASAIISSCNTSACSQCHDDVQKTDDSLSSKLFKTILYKIPYKAKTDTDIEATRILPKDSLEVFKRRKIYAASLKSQWACSEDKPVSVPSIESKGAQDTSTECPKLEKSICKSPRSRHDKKTCKKRVSMLDSDTLNEMLAVQLSDKKPDGILAFKGQSGCEACKIKGTKCAKHATVKAKPIQEIPQPPCKPTCEDMKDPPCNKLDITPSCNISPNKSPNLSVKLSSASPEREVSRRTPHSLGSPMHKMSCEQCKPYSHTVPDSPPSDPASSPRCPASTPRCPSSLCRYPASPPQLPASPPRCPASPPRRPASPPRCPAYPTRPTASPPRPTASPSRRPTSPPRSPASPPRCPASPPRCPASPPQPPASPPRCPASPPIRPASPPRCPASPPRRPASPPRCPASPPRCPASPPSKHSGTRRKAKPDIRCGSPPSSPPLSPEGSPRTSHNCLSPAESHISHKVISPNQKQRRCPQCQGPQPCSKFPLCKLSPLPIQHSPDGSPKQSPKASPPSSPMASKKSSPAPKLNKTGSPKCPPTKKPPKTSPCRLPPCNNIKKASSPADTSPKSPCGSDIFPWPMNNQVSNPPSPTCSETNHKKDKCHAKCSMLPKTSNQTLAPTKECKPDCANQKKKLKRPETIPQVSANNEQQPCPAKQQQPSPKPQQPCPMKEQQSSPTKQQQPSPKPQQPCPMKEQQPSPKPQQPCPAKPQPPVKKNCIEMSKARISGLFLKMKPSKKKTSEKCSKECLAWQSQEDRGVLRLNSRENITISMKKDTPSTEEIRDCMDLKVRDDDGNTLYERKDYTCGRSGHRPSVLGDMYKDSNINRVSTPVMVVAKDATENSPKQQEEENNYKSEASLTNLIEIQFKLRITQGDKTTEIRIANEDEEKQDKGNEVCNTGPEVFVVENEGKEQEKCVEEAPKNDINIKIVVKNYKPKPTKFKEVKNDHDNEFSKNISAKFHTVSTGYSDVLTDQEDDNVFSVHRTTIDLDSLDDKSKTVSKLSNEMISEDLTEPINYIISSHSIDVTEDENNENTLSIKKDNFSDKYNYTNDDKDSESDKDVLDDLNTSNECFELKYNAKEEKKELLKKVFEKASKKPKNKETVRELRNTLKIILTDSSDNDEINAASNELANDITYASLKPDFFRNTDSMNNYYKMESYLTVEGSKITSNNLFPTEENYSYDSGTSKSIKQGCMCKHVAEKLNCDLKIGCCCRPRKIDEVTSCDFKNEQDVFLLNYRSDNVDAFTQKSKDLSIKTNSMNLSIHSNDNSVQIETDKISIKENSMNTNDSKTMKREAKTFSPHMSHIKDCEMKKLNRTTLLGISDDDKIVLLKDESITTKKSRKSMLGNIYKASDVLQCYETKKAVLEIYAEKTLSENGEHFVAKLPKFVYEKESEITRNYEQIATNSYKSVCKRNVFRMSVG